MKAPSLPYISPPSLANHPEAQKLFDAAVHQTLEAYRAMVNAGVAPEDARYIFPNAIETKLVFTLNFSAACLIFLNSAAVSKHNGRFASLLLNMA